MHSWNIYMHMASMHWHGLFKLLHGFLVYISTGSLWLNMHSWTFLIDVVCESKYPILNEQMALMHDDVILCVACTSGRGLVVMIPKKYENTTAAAVKYFFSCQGTVCELRQWISSRKVQNWPAKEISIHFHVHVTSSCISAITSIISWHRRHEWRHSSLRMFCIFLTISFCKNFLL